MKKIIALFVIMLAFGATANAQQRTAVEQQKKNTTTPEAKAADNEAIQKAAARDFELMSSSIQLTEEQQKMYKRLFVTKQRTLAVPNLSEERKAILAESIEAKIKSGLDSDQIAKLESNPELLKALTH